MEQTIVIPDENVEIYDVVEEINHEHELCIRSMKNTLEHAIKIGELLIQQKEKVQYGDWTIWVKMNCNFDFKQAWRYMKIAENLAHAPKLEEATSIRHALRILGIEEKKPKPAELPEPEDKKYFSWFDDERVTDVYDAIKKINSTVTFLKSAKEDRGAIEQILKQWDTALNKIIENIRE